MITYNDDIFIHLQLELNNFQSDTFIKIITETQSKTATSFAQLRQPTYPQGQPEVIQRPFPDLVINFFYMVTLLFLPHPPFPRQSTRTLFS